MQWAKLKDDVNINGVVIDRLKLQWAKLKDYTAKCGLSMLSVLIIFP